MSKRSCQVGGHRTKHMCTTARIKKMWRSARKGERRNAIARKAWSRPTMPLVDAVMETIQHLKEGAPS